MYAVLKPHHHLADQGVYTIVSVHFREDTAISARKKTLDATSLVVPNHAIFFSVAWLDNKPLKTGRWLAGDSVNKHDICLMDV